MKHLPLRLLYLKTAPRKVFTYLVIYSTPARVPIFQLSPGKPRQGGGCHTPTDPATFGEI